MTKHRQEQKKKLGYQKKRNKDKVPPLKLSEPYRVGKKDNKGKAPIRTTGKQVRDEMEASDDIEMEDVAFEVIPMMISQTGREKPGESSRTNAVPEPEPEPQTQPPNAPQETFNARPPRVRPKSKYKPPPKEQARRPKPALDPKLAPDGLPKREINKHAWETLRSLTLRTITYKNARGKKVTDVLPAVTLNDVDSTFVGELGFRMEFGTGRHRKFIWNNKCVLPEWSLSRNFSFNPDGDATAGSKLIKETMDNWGSCLAEAGITWGFTKQWFIQKKEKKEAEEKEKEEKEKEKEKEI
ncbi:hypothetical protein FGADI_6600 [Fusarium gaditjirri]|uniref:Uncharacterized protein n=1 Tax=Fusarium gaditjirri TaxID=282569 RepID=A0A8H4T7F3_9HYPO|nr:hypothetical protein FGADI_6600 [Fusarium gaditjirri]